MKVPAIVRRALFALSAVAAAVVAAALLVNYVVMPIMVRQGDLVPAPDLAGRSLVEARRVAEEAGLGIRVSAEQPDPEIPAGAIVEQKPGPGVDVKRGRSMAVVVSAGLDLKVIPPLSGLTARQAQLDAEAAGFAVSRVGEVHTDRIERGRVVGTMPRSGSIMPAGSGIVMVVSLGPRPLPLVMPSLVGRTPEEARMIAEELGLVVRSVRYDRARSDVLRDVVVVQEPVAGARVVEGNGVTLRVGKG
ncbi:MAG: PASTA domain-containing protein [Candidatus Eisenbacteria bacterium]|nr:PASTA domain-containing protein [Candidatus Eisenbacteria bacterium]